MIRYRVMRIVVAVTAVWANVVMAADPIVYSGPNRNIVYDQSSSPTISIFESPETWDDIKLSASVLVIYGVAYLFDFTSMDQSQGNYVQFALGTDRYCTKRFSSAQMIGPSQTYMTTGDSSTNPR